MGEFNSDDHYSTTMGKGTIHAKMDSMGEFNSDNHYIYYCGQESLRRNGVAHSQQKNPKCSTWMQSQK